MFREALGPLLGRSHASSPRTTAGRHRGRETPRTFRRSPGVRRWARGIAEDRSSLAGALFVLLGLGGAVAIAVTRSELLPAKFSYDARFIQTLAQGRTVPDVDRSYSNTGAMYRLLGLQDVPVVVALITVAIFGVLVVAALLSRPDGRLPIPIGLLAGVSLLLGAVYLGTYSKDAPVLAVSAALLLLGRNRRAECGVLAVMAVYATVFRTYWFLVLGVYIAVRVFQRFWPRRPVWLLGALGALVILGFGIVLALHQPADHFRFIVNSGRAGDLDAKTIVQPFLDLPEPWGGIGNVMITFFTLFVPFPLLLLGSSYYIAVFLLFVAIWGSFWWALVRSAPVGADHSGQFRASAFVIGFVTVQAFFEPDYGSALRHLTPLLPVLLFVVLGAVGRRRERVPARARRGSERITSSRSTEEGAASTEFSRTERPPALPVQMTGSTSQRDPFEAAAHHIFQPRGVPDIAVRGPDVA